MAIFFLLVGLEVKREWYEGRLATPAGRRLPIIAAIAGMAVPALVYLAVTRGDPVLLSGWAIPAATAILLGLFVGKQIGVFAAVYAVVRSGLAPMPRGTNGRQLWGAATLCGIGFTMSLFIGALAFPASPELVEAAKIGTLAGSLLSALVGFLILRTAPAELPTPEDQDDSDDVFCAVSEN